VSQKRGIDLRVLIGLVGLLIVGGVVALLSTGGSSAHKASAAANGGFESAGVMSPATQAPPLALRNYLGQPVNIDSFRGRPVLVTFIYTHCPDVCPLITSNLRVAQSLMGPKVAANTQIIAVSVDPRGDTRSTVADFLAKHQMTGRMLYLVGSAHELAQAWQAWGVGSERDASKPEFINHSGLVYGVTASGKRLTIYAANFQPSEIAHDAPLLAAR
jgi:protein SCO1/2